MALDWCQNFVYAQCLVDQLMGNVCVAKRLALLTSDHGVAGSNPAGSEILPEPKQRFIAQSLSCSPFHCLEMTEILLKGHKTLTHPSIQLMDFDKILWMHWYWQYVGKDNYKLLFVFFQLTYGPWLMSAFYFHLISWEQIDGFWWNFVWPTREIFPNFSTESWPLIDVKISIFLNIFRNNEWILIKFCLCIDIYDPCCD